MKCLIIFFYFSIYMHSFHAWSWNSFKPHCLIKECTEESEQERKLEKESDKDSWIPNCESVIITNYDWFGSVSNIVIKENNHWYCNLKKSSHEKLENLKNYLNAAKPQQTIVENIFSAELSPYCWFTECCNRNSIPANTKQFRLYLKNHVYGQPLLDTIIDALDSHWNTNVEPKKPLVMSFHGSVGTGKNYVADFLAKSLFKLGAKSKFVHNFSGRVHATLDSAMYKNQIYQWLKGNITACPKQLFIFDEVDKMPETILDTLKPLLDYRESVDGADYRNAIFIFISNTGSSIISKHYKTLLSSGKKKTNIELKDFEKFIIDGAFHEKGGFHHSDTITYNVIDHYIPFLPLEEEEIVQCIIDSFNVRNINEPLPEHITLVLEYLERVHTTDNGNLRNALATVDDIEYDRLLYPSGCKQVFSKVGLIVAKFYKKHNRAEL